MKWLPKLFERRSTNQAVGGDSYWTDFAALRTVSLIACTQA